MQKKYLVYLFIGIMGGLAFFIKQTSVGIWIAIILFSGYEGIRNKIIKKCIKEISIIIMGGLGVAIILLGYFFINNALYEFWDSAFLYNFFYYLQRVNSLSDRFWNFVDVHTISKMGFFQIAAIGLASFIFKIYKKNIELHRGAVSLLMVGMIDFPLELLLINIPGKAYEHYFITILPTLALFSCLLFFLVGSAMTNNQTISKNEQSFLIFAILFMLAFSGMRDYRNNVLGLQHRFNEKAIRYIISQTDPDDSILVLGAETMVNFYTRRISPTRYVYQYPLYSEGYTSEEKIIEFLDDIIDNKPKIIMNTKGGDDPLFAFPIQTREIEEKQGYIESNYPLVDEVNTWGVYVYK